MIRGLSRSPSPSASAGRPTASNTSCCTGSGPMNSAAWRGRARACGCTCPTAATGTATWSGGWQSARRIWRSFSVRYGRLHDWVVVVIAILGAGKMGEALISGLLRAGRPVTGVAAVVRREARAEELRTAYGLPVITAEEAAKTASTLVITVKPQDMARMLAEIADFVDPSKLVISAAAGITTSFIERHFPVDVPVVRVMSNTPVLVDEAMSVISPG